MAERTPKSASSSNFAPDRLILRSVRLKVVKFKNGTRESYAYIGGKARGQGTAAAGARHGSCQVQGTDIISKILSSRQIF